MEVTEISLKLDDELIFFNFRTGSDNCGSPYSWNRGCRQTVVNESAHDRRQFSGKGLVNPEDASVNLK